MSFPHADLHLVRERLQRYEREAAEHRLARLARRRPDEERTPRRAVVAPPIDLTDGEAAVQSSSSAARNSNRRSPSRTRVEEIQPPIAPKCVSRIEPSSRLVSSSSYDPS
jgi:hypothetical protein